MRISDWSSDVCSSDLMTATAMVHQDRKSASAPDARWSGNPHVVGCVGDRDVRSFGFAAMEDAVVAAGKRMGEDFKVVEVLDSADQIMSDNGHDMDTPVRDGGRLEIGRAHV